MSVLASYQQQEPSKADLFTTVLQRFATEPQQLANERSCLPVAPRARLEAILREIDETVLPKRLVLESTQGPALTLSVGNRRLSGLFSAEHLFPLQEASCALLAKVLVCAAEDANRISVEPPENTDKFQSTDGGFTVTALRGAADRVAQIDAIDLLDQLLKPVSIALLRWQKDHTAIDFAGQASWRAALEPHAKRQIESFGASQRTPETEVNGTALPIDCDKLVLSACDADHGIAAIVPLDLGLNAIRLWQTLVAKLVVAKDKPQSTDGFTVPLMS